MWYGSVSSVLFAVTVDSIHSLLLLKDFLDFLLGRLLVFAVEKEQQGPSSWSQFLQHLIIVLGVDPVLIALNVNVTEK